MKNFKKLIGLLLILMSFGAYASTPVLTMVPIDHVYSPKGFDSNDSAEIIISGFLPNLCHKAPQTKVVVKGKKIEIQVTSLYYEPTNPFCPEMIVPFVEAVDVGLLDKGHYDILVNGKSVFERKAAIYINEASSDAVDDYTYANVEYVEKEMGSRVVKLKGYNPSDCFVLDSIDMIDNGKDTFSVLPKMKQISDFCPMKMVPFSYDMEVPSNLNEEKVLLHVRVMDGKSINSIFNNKSNDNY
ncbi:MAG: hypothetical protein KC493_12890 [Bacteriovoracaceae bacterium]|nr:hypothetical protein [Bacteriovoracaceae bacterium]